MIKKKQKAENKRFVKVLLADKHPQEKVISNSEYVGKHRQAKKGLEKDGALV